MTTSNSYDFAPTCDELLIDAVELCGVADIGSALESEIKASVLRSLNMMLKSWQAEGLFLWTWKEATLFLQKGQRQYNIGPSGWHVTESYVETTLSAAAATNATTLALTSTTGITASDYIGIQLDDGSMHWTTVVNPATTTITAGLPSPAASGNVVYAYTTKVQRPVSIDDDIVCRNTSDIDRPVKLIASKDYASLGNKMAAGAVVQAVYDPQLTNGVLTVYPVPENSTDRLIFSMKRPVQDIDDGENTLEIPPDCYKAVVTSLAYDISPKFNVPFERQEGLRKRALEAKGVVDDSDGPSIFFVVDRR